MHPRHRDGLLALVGFVVLLGGGLVTVGSEAFRSPAAVVVGVAGMVVLEVAFLRYPGRSLAVWDRPGVAVAALGGLLVVALVAVRVQPWVLGALTWGLLAYLVLLGIVLSGLGNPLAPLARIGREDRE